MQVHIVIARHKENLKWLFQLMADKSWMTDVIESQKSQSYNGISQILTIARMA
jgi:hypothetical protein